MGKLTLICRCATTFSPVTGEFDEEAFQKFLQRFIDANLGVYLASGGSGEGHSLEWEELRRIYRVGVQVCKGKIPVNSNQPEQHTAKASLAHAQLAKDAGVDVVNIYGPEGRHGFRATDDEYVQYFDSILSELRHPVALCPNPTIGYPTSAPVIAGLCAKYPQVTTVNLSGITGDQYFIELKDALTREVEIYVPYPGSVHTLDMGATGLLGAEANFVPHTFREYIDAYEQGDLAKRTAAYRNLRLVTEYVKQWKASTPRWIKMAMKAFKLPGGEGGVREPYRMPDQVEIDRFATGAIALDVPEIGVLAEQAGLVGAKH